MEENKKPSEVLAEATGIVRPDAVRSLIKDETAARAEQAAERPLVSAEERTLGKLIGPTEAPPGTFPVTPAPRAAGRTITASQITVTPGSQVVTADLMQPPLSQGGRP